MHTSLRQATLNSRFPGHPWEQAQVWAQTTKWQRNFYQSISRSILIPRVTEFSNWVWTTKLDCVSSSNRLNMVIWGWSPFHFFFQIYCAFLDSSWNQKTWLPIFRCQNHLIPSSSFPESGWLKISDSNNELWALDSHFSSVHFTCSVVSDSLWHHEQQHAKPPCPSPTPGVPPNPCPSSRWCHLTISSSVVPFSSCPQSFAASGSFPMSQLFAWGGQSIGVSASTSGGFKLNYNGIPSLHMLRQL